MAAPAPGSRCRSACSGSTRAPTASDEARKLLKAALKESPLKEQGRGRAFYMVGGSWRALARIDMLATDFPLPITHQYRMKPARANELRKLVRALDPTAVERRCPAAPRDVAGRRDAARIAGR